MLLLDDTIEAMINSVKQILDRVERSQNTDDFEESEELVRSMVSSIFYLKWMQLDMLKNEKKSER